MHVFAFQSTLPQPSRARKQCVLRKRAGFAGVHLRVFSDPTGRLEDFGTLPKVIPLFLSLQAGGQAFFSHSPESSRTAYIVCCAVLKLCALVLGRFRINRIDILCPRRHRTEISKIPMYADSILKMLKDIRKTVRASSKLQPGPNAFAQFLEEVSTHSTR